MPIEKGTIKVVWVTSSTKKIYSKMFENVKDAEKFGKSKRHYIIFRLLWHKNYKTYSWEILPYGKYKLYMSALKFYMKNGKKISVVEKLFKL